MSAERPIYDPDNPFAKILRGEARAHVVHQDDHCMAFMDLMPQTPGHTLIIPRTPAAEIFELPADDLARSSPLPSASPKPCARSSSLPA